jgi:hypothetical protein
VEGAAWWAYGYFFADYENALWTAYKAGVTSIDPSSASRRPGSAYRQRVSKLERMVRDTVLFELAIGFGGGLPAELAARSLERAMHSFGYLNGLYRPLVGPSAAKLAWNLYGPKGSHRHMAATCHNDEVLAGSPLKFIAAAAGTRWEPGMSEAEKGEAIRRILLNACYVPQEVVDGILFMRFDDPYRRPKGSQKAP